MAAALQTLPQVHDERARQPIQRMMASKIVVSRPRCYASSLGAGYAGVSNRQTYMRTCDGLGGRQRFYEQELRS
jgi:hypothetical protein